MKKTEKQMQEFFTCMKAILDQVATLQKYDQLGSNAIIAIIDLIMSRDKEYLKTVLQYNQDIKQFSGMNRGNQPIPVNLDKKVKAEVDDIIKLLENVELNKEDADEILRTL